LEPSVRAQVITRRTYNREITPGQYETWAQTVDRVIEHQKWLWMRAKSHKKWTEAEARELAELKKLLLERRALPSGRTLWLGGTEVSKRREASQFNCSFLRVETVHDVVDAFWLLLQGCGVGFEPVVGTLSGFGRPVDLEVIRSVRTEKGGYTENIEQFHGDHWIIKVGDSAEAWAKAVGKLLAYKGFARKLTIDFSEVRPAGERLAGYGWISSGDATFSSAVASIVELLNRRAGRLLTRIDILDILNHLGTTLSSRRSAEIAVVPYGDPEWVDFAKAKKDHWSNGNPQRAQSNNSLVFYHKPSIEELRDIFDLMVASGGSEPGFINGAAALKRAPWFKGVNPCAEILLGNKSFCNLVEVDLAKFNGDEAGLHRAIRLIARANYRQTCVDLRDGVLQSTWHELNSFLRLTGVGLTGIVRWEHRDKGEAFVTLRKLATKASYDMADELNMPRSLCVTTVKPSGTLSKIMDTTEGLHKPLGRYVFNNVRFSVHDNTVARLQAAGYHTFPDPYASDGVLVRLPVENPEVDFQDFGGTPVNLESAVAQLERYKLLMENYVSHNASITVSYDTTEVPEIVKWVHDNWDTYVGVSFLFRNDPTKTAEDLGYPYLPQEVVTKEVYEAYVAGLKTVVLDDLQVGELEDDCATGACPIR
jgi:adenosylcobalamin-dependent ribonucleoside-triphosphate reductase